MNDYPVMLVFGLLLSSLIFGYRTYIAWMLPDKHWDHLHYWADFYAGWSKLGEEWWRSQVQFWIMRIAYTMGFVISLTGVIGLSLNYLRQ